MTEREKKEVVRLRKNGLSFGMIAKKTGLASTTIKSFITRNADAVSAEPARNISLSGTCRRCGAAIYSISGHKERRFCSDGCRSRYWIEQLDKANSSALRTAVCEHCSKAFSYYGTRQRQFCSRECYLAFTRKGGGGCE